MAGSEVPEYGAKTVPTGRTSPRDRSQPESAFVRLKSSGLAFLDCTKPSLLMDFSCSFRPYSFGLLLDRVRPKRLASYGTSFHVCSCQPPTGCFLPEPMGAKYVTAPNCQSRKHMLEPTSEVTGV